MKELSFTEIITKNLISIVLALFFLPVVVFGQDYEGKFYADDGRNPGGDVIIKKSFVKIDGNLAYRIFEVEAPEAGPFYLSAWLMAASTDKGPREYKVQINGNEHLTLKPEKANWQSVTFRDENQNLASAELRVGLNTIAFITQVPEIPMVEFVRLSKDQEKTNIQGTEYETFLSDIKKETEVRKNNPTPERDSLISLKNGIILPNPEGNYYHHIEATFKYTFYTYVYLQAGQQAFFATNANNFKHVLEVFSYNETESYSWVATSGSGSLASINVNIPYTDTYFVRVRAYWQNEQGLVNLNVNGQYYYQNCTASGWAGFRHFHTTPVEYNYFTCHINGDTRLWIEDSGLPGRIIGWNDDYWGSGDFYWGLASRVKKNFSTNVGAALFSSYSSITPTGTCDLYIKCQNGNDRTFPGGYHLTDYFEQLKADDAIESAPNSSVYNCISWSGGITNYWEWPLSPSSDFYIPNDPLGSFDAFYSSRGFTRDGATSSNSCIALWKSGSTFMHGSVRKPANGHPHGYDWESKAGPQSRFFHPKDAVGGTNGYGAISYYYKEDELKSAALFDFGDMLLEEAIEKGLAVMADANYSDEELAYIDSSIQLLPRSIVDEFNVRFELWLDSTMKPEYAIVSNPDLLKENKEYENLINFCKSNGNKILPLVFEKLQSEQFTLFLLEDLAYERNKDLMDEVKEENKSKVKSSSGAVIINSPHTNAIKFAKKLMATGMSLNIDEESLEIFNDIDNINVYPNPVSGHTTVNYSLLTDARVNISIIDLNGKEIMNVIASNQNKGYHSINIDMSNIKKGVYLCRFTINDNTVIRKLIIQ